MGTEELAEDPEVPVIDEEPTRCKKLARVLDPHIYGVAAITVGNGGDNLGVYIPLVARCDWVELILTLIVFYFLIAVWCWMGRRLGESAVVSRVIQKYEKVLVPLVLICLGIFILIGCHSSELIWPPGPPQHDR